MTDSEDWPPGLPPRPRDPGQVAEEGFGPGFTRDYIVGFWYGRHYERERGEVGQLVAILRKLLGP